MKRLKIKKLSTHREFEECIRIQREVWKHEDIDLVPLHHYCISVETGAILLGAFLGKEMVGFVYSFPAFSKKKIHQHSHLLAVLPEYQGLAIGKKLKWTQRHYALRLGYDMITWTFDPLQARNANLNLHTLGATIKTYLTNFYGETPSLTLGFNVPTDRFFTEWLIKHEVVLRRKKEQYEKYDPSELPKALQARKNDDRHFLPGQSLLSLNEEKILIEVPAEIRQFLKQPDNILKWQEAIRRVMKHYFSKGYRGVDFIFGECCFYVLGKWPYFLARKRRS
jgi:predicted GNAT superfamily acetyltransferase